ncbi:TIGR01906 family membrane protein [Lentilactobacillus kisonensis]|uniref:TIGR01906 family protein n=1 Tax=Lentilactobacillus kisonensis DSM 19906 = JCM 15041 TaxID=1423766 RepID=A0A0R1P3D8_9LACO|nr:TIGR01906 family membrane protein [Lentilactobacillus kisonensis]KRL23291.1 TIGR01906 family protein [Lentilactobacillus kisonensis DSM 19906 = JCM 15041]
MKLTLKQISFSIIIILGCLSLAIFLTVNSVWLFAINIPMLHLVKATGLEPTQMLHEYTQIIKYLQLPWISSLHFHYFFSSMKGMQHFSDVRHLIMLNNFVGLFLVPITGYLLHRLNKKSLTWLLITPIKVVVTLSLMIIVMMFLNFDQLFIYFHELLFRNNDWLFDPNTDPVINMLPDTFFLECFGLFFIFFCGALGLIYWLGRRSLARFVK